jgi:hypothetical protein
VVPRDGSQKEVAGTLQQPIRCSTLVMHVNLVARHVHEDCIGGRLSNPPEVQAGSFNVVVFLPVHSTEYK